MHGINEMRAKLWSGNLKGRDFLRHRRRQEDNIKLNLREIGCEGYGLNSGGSK
jgi:hypothetical protein